MDKVPYQQWLAAIENATSSVTPAQCCQGVFVLLGASAVVVNNLPAKSRKLLMDYGARETAEKGTSAGAKKEGSSTTTTTTMTTTDAATVPPPQEPTPNIVDRIITAFATRTGVPHSWFTSFYAGYLVFALFWGTQWWLWRQQPSETVPSTFNIFGWLVARQDRLSRDAGTPSATVAQVYLVAGLEVLQTGRRLYEHFAIMRPSKTSKMNVAHWIVGIAFYACVSVAVWIEGSQAFVARKTGIEWPPATSPQTELLKGIVGMFLYVFAWINQFQCHVYLASLKKYSLPEEDLFRYLVCPHYSCECLLYFSLSIIAAPEGRLFNRTVLSSLAFTVTALGMTADGTKKWYASKFGEERVAKKWRMIPFVF